MSRLAAKNVLPGDLGGAERMKAFAIFARGDTIGGVVEPVQSLFFYELDAFCFDDGRFVGALWNLSAQRPDGHGGQIQRPL